MSSAGQAVGGVVGAVAGFFIGGPSGALYGAQIGMMAGGLIDPPKGPNITGPRLDDLKVQTSTYGAPIPRLYGTIATAGNIFWLENNALKEVAKKKKSGGKGGQSTTTTTFSYYATFAIGLCDCSDGVPIAGVRRIWIGSKLVYDSGSSDLMAIIASNKAATFFTLHNGSYDQNQDERMQATLGVSNTPAYRGLAYIVFNDYPLADHGNSLIAAVVKVEVIKSGATDLFTLTSGYSDTTNRYDMAWDGRTLCTIGAGGVVDVSIDGLNWEHYTMPATGWQSIASNGKIFVAIATANQNVAISKNSGKTWSLIASALPAGDTYLKIIWTGNKFCSIGHVYSAVSNDGISWTRGNMPSYADWRAAVWNGFVFCAVANQSNVSATSEDGLFWTSGVMPASSNWRGVEWNGSVFCAVSTASISATSEDGLIWEKHSAPSGMSRILFGAGYFLVVSGSSVIYSQDGIYWIQELRGIPPTISLGAAIWNGAYFCYYDNSANHFSFIVRPELLTAVPATLSGIVQSEALSSNLLAVGDIDTSALTQQVRGYRITAIAAIRAAIEPLQAAWPFDVIQSGYKIVFKPRGGSSVVTIPYSDLDARGDGDSTGVSITNVREMDSVLPRRVVANYLDVTREYDTGTQADERLNTDSVNIRTIEMAIVLNATEALGIVQTLLYLYWLERYDLSFSLPSVYNHLEAGDSITVNSDEATYSLRLTGITYTQDGRLECTAKYDAPAIYIRTAIGEEGTSTGQTLALAGATAFELLDIPLLLDSLDQPGFPVAMTGYLSGWPGGELFRSDDYGQTWDDIQGFGKPGAVIGTASNVIGATVTAMIDKSSVLTVSLIGGELSSVTELAMLNGANYFAYGVNGRWEIIAAQNCALQGDGSYILTDLLRGQQGTEWACGLHVVGDLVIALDASLAFVGASLNSIGSSKTYRGVTLGKTLDSASDTPFTYTGVNLECLSPVYLNGGRHPTTDDWTLTWIRRTRVGGGWRDYVDATLGEASESYEVEIYSSNAYTTLKRTLSGLSTPAASYTSAQQVTDFGGKQATLYVKVYQLSANVGRGYPLTTSITR